MVGLLAELDEKSAAAVTPLPVDLGRHELTHPRRPASRVHRRHRGQARGDAAREAQPRRTGGSQSGRVDDDRRVA